MANMHNNNKNCRFVNNVTWHTFQDKKYQSL